MSAPNYIIRDTVRYIPCEEEYRQRRALGRTLRNLKTNLWVFGTLVAPSAGPDQGGVV